MIKYRVKFKCHWYNTGNADNHSYDNFEDFDTIEQAKEFQSRVNTQYGMSKRRILYEGVENEPASTFEERYCPPITYKELNEWNNSPNYVKVENGFIEGRGHIFEYHPDKEIEIK